MDAQGFQKQQKERLLACYGETSDSLVNKSVISALNKAEEVELEKGGQKATIGEKRMFAGREYIKTADGWKYHGKGAGTKV